MYLSFFPEYLIEYIQSQGRQADVGLLDISYVESEIDCARKCYGDIHLVACGPVLFNTTFNNISVILLRSV
jgi:hypothetical protein